MLKRAGLVLAAMLVLVLATGSGCVKKKQFELSMEDTDRRIAAVEDAVEGNERKIGDLKQSTDSRISQVDGKTQKAMNVGNQAMTTAKAAEEAARGKLIWDVTITDDKVKFDFGKAQLSSGAISELERLISRVKGYGKALYIEVEGHTDNIGAEMLNEKLGATRAVAVRNYLNEKGGIPLHAINIISYGESRPIADNSSNEGRAQNRRVVIRVLE